DGTASPCCNERPSATSRTTRSTGPGDSPPTPEAHADPTTAVRTRRGRRPVRARVTPRRGGGGPVGRPLPAPPGGPRCPRTPDPRTAARAPPGAPPPPGPPRSW